MKQFLLSLLIFSVSTFPLFSQISKGGLPKSFTENINSSIDRIEIKPVNINTIKAEDNKFPKDGHPVRVGYTISTDISLINSGTWTELSNGGKIWQVQIKSPGALAISVYFDQFRLPYGSSLFLYNEDKSQVIGAFTSENNDKSGLFATELIYGDIVNLEYYEPVIVMFRPEFHIDKISYCYKGVQNHKNPTWTEPSDVCEVNVNCSPVGDNWKDEKQGVARMYIIANGGTFWCSGSLVNNTNQDCKPYFLSAFHCYEGATVSELNQWVFYFNYESSGCTTPGNEPAFNTLTGASLKSYGNISGGSDFILLELNQSVPISYNPYFNGWNRQNSFSGPGVGIHHPAGSIKKISTFNTAVSATYTSGPGADNAHWSLSWVSNSNGWGVTEGGSSYCIAQSDPDYYGKMYYHWDLNGSNSSSRLKDWLDPAGTNPQTLNGKYCNSPILAYDTLMPASFSNSSCFLTIYYADNAAPWDSGFVNGQNAYLDKEKAMLYSGTNGGTISDVFAMYALKAGTTGTTTAKIYSSVSGAPGTLLGTSSSINKSAIDTTNQGVNFLNKYHFSTPVNVGSDFFVSITLPSSFNSGTNELAIWSSQYNCSSTSPLAFELWSSDNAWHSFLSAYGTNMDLAILPVIYGPVGITDNEINNQVLLFPNPATDEINLVLHNNESGEVSINIYDIYGKLCKTTLIRNSSDGPVKIDVRSLSDGLFIITGESESGRFSQKLLIVR